MCQLQDAEEVNPHKLREEAGKSMPLQNKQELIAVTDVS